ncbi:hypothetical protein ACJJTC_005650 [Scirpophaga incertulas]
MYPALIVKIFSEYLSNRITISRTKRERVTRKKQNDILKKQSELLESAKILISGDGTSADAFGTPSSEQSFGQRYAYQQQVPKPSLAPSSQHHQPSPYVPSPTPSPSPQHHQPSPYAPSPTPSPQHRQPSPYQSSPSPSPQHYQPSPYAPSPTPSLQHRQPSPSPKYSHTAQSQPSLQHSQPSPSTLPQLPPSSHSYQQHIVSPQLTSDDSSSQLIYDLPPIPLDSTSLINDYPNTSFELSSNQQQVFRGKAKELNKYLIFKK